MTIEGIIRMAKQAGFADEEIDYCQQILIHFATLVAQQEREACAQMLETASKTGKIISCTSAAKAIRARGQA